MMKERSKNLTDRTTEEVFEEHLHLAKTGEIELDIKRNYSADAVLLTNYGRFSGADGIREAAALLQKQLPNGTYDYKLKTYHKELCFLLWTGLSDTAKVPDGADSFLIRNGEIQVQTIYYSVQELTK